MLFMVDREQAERLKSARQSRGFETAEAACERYGFNPVTYRSHESARRGFGKKQAQVYADRYRVNLVWLLTGQGETEAPPKVPVVGYVGAGAQMLAFDDHEKGAGLDFVDPPPGVGPDHVCVIVRGDSMYPVYKDGDLLFFHRDGAPPKEYLGRECIVRLADGRSMVKVVASSGTPGKFTLTSFNAPPIAAELEWAAPVLWVKKGW